MNAAMTFDSRLFYDIHVTFVNPFTSDATVERIGTYLYRPTEVFTHKVAPWHPAIATLVRPCTAPAASNKHQFSYGIQQIN
ncbi:hypothetical protein [Shewanella hanedai]|uniref:Uncharacterized protein n=1 Tax=Shewanella hanedai TaxID=25 RepID=A0A553JFD1_SHEHA|nr:hypothetical protein [Shewanella hanedai]TRY11133.1 hypothetical protein FN961_24250 [Shewanella hanedai]